jgi:hypothetical protein
MRYWSIARQGNITKKKIHDVWFLIRRVRIEPKIVAFGDRRRDFATARLHIISCKKCCQSSLRIFLFRLYPERT